MRTIEQILTIRFHAAQLRVSTSTIRLMADPDNEKLQEGLHLANEALALADDDRKALAGGTELAPFEPTTMFALKRYALLLTQATKGLTMGDALAQAQEDEQVRRDDWMTRKYGEYEPFNGEDDGEY